MRWSPIAPVLLLTVALVPRACAADPPAIRQLESKHLTLLTDLPVDAEVDALPGYFDQAFPQWCAYFGVEPEAHADWHVRACLMRSRERFAAAGMIGDDVPDFTTGYTLSQKVWVYEQASPYYRRHLLLHEGTHAFMYASLGDVGPAWFAEGLAELLATHKLDGGRLTLNYFPRTREDVPKWGRIEVVQTDYAARHAKLLDTVFALHGTIHGTVDNYGWCWATAAFLDGNGRYRDRFRALAPHVAQGDFARRVTDAFAADRARLDEDWEVFVANIDYGYDFERMEFDAAPGEPLTAPGKTVDVASDRGWQSSGVALAAGRKYRLRATGRYQVAQTTKPWIADPGGVTLRYNQGRPLGMLLAAIRPDDPAANTPSGLIKPIAVGLETTLEPRESGTLYFRINDSAGQLSDNSGRATVEITAAE